MEEFVAKSDRLPSEIERETWIEDYVRLHGRYHSCCKSTLTVECKASNGEVMCKLYKM